MLNISTRSTKLGWRYVATPAAAPVPAAATVSRDNTTSTATPSLTEVSHLRKYY